MQRRSFLASILAAGVAPAAVGSSILMPVRKIIMPGNSWSIEPDGRAVFSSVTIPRSAFEFEYIDSRGQRDWVPACGDRSGNGDKFLFSLPAGATLVGIRSTRVYGRAATVSLALANPPAPE